MPCVLQIFAGGRFGSRKALSRAANADELLAVTISGSLSPIGAICHRQIQNAATSPVTGRFDRRCHGINSPPGIALGLDCCDGAGSACHGQGKDAIRTPCMPAALAVVGETTGGEGVDEWDGPVADGVELHAAVNKPSPTADTKARCIT
jgi:hypothetical protein